MSLDSSKAIQDELYIKFERYFQEHKSYESDFRKKIVQKGASLCILVGSYFGTRQKRHLLKRLY